MSNQDNYLIDWSKETAPFSIVDNQYTNFVIETKIETIQDSISDSESESGLEITIPQGNIHRRRVTSGWQQIFEEEEGALEENLVVIDEIPEKDSINEIENLPSTDNIELQRQREIEEPQPATPGSNTKIRSVVITDSIGKYIKIQGTPVIFERGLTLCKLYHRLIEGTFKVNNYKIVLIHVGTNDIKENISKFAIEKKLQEITEFIKKNNIGAIIGFSSILPMPGFNIRTEIYRKKVNSLYKYFCQKEGIEFLPSWKKFSDKATNQAITKLYAIDRWHLSRAGTEKLRLYLSGTLMRLKGEISQ